MRRSAARFCVVVAIAATCALQSASPAELCGLTAVQGNTVRYPTDITVGELRVLLQACDEPTTIIFEKGDYAFSPQLFVLNRSNLTIRGETGRARDVTIQSDGGGSGSGGTAVFLMEQVSNVELRDITIRSTAPSSGQGVRLNAQLSQDFSSFVDGVTLDGCTIEAEFPVVATAGARNLTVIGSTLECGRSDGFALAWGDGPGLLVTKSKFTTAPGVAALSAIFVQGAGAQFSEGERAEHVILTRNKVTGDYLRGFDLADVLDARVRKNSFVFPGDSSRLFGGVPTGRVGVLVRRGASSSLPSDYEVTKNKARNAFYGAWILNGGRGAVYRNDFRRCGSPSRDGFFQEFGGGVRLTLFSANCLIEIANNDFRNLKSPKLAQADPNQPSSPIVDVPAVVVVPTELSGACFEGDDNRGNKTSNGRVLYLGASE